MTGFPVAVRLRAARLLMFSVVGFLVWAIILCHGAEHPRAQSLTVDPPNDGADNQSHEVLGGIESVYCPVGRECLQRFRGNRIAHQDSRQHASPNRQPGSISCTR